MRLSILLFFAALPLSAQDRNVLEPLPGPSTGDWLVAAPERSAGVYRTADGDGIALDNGLVRRVFRLGGGVGAISYQELHSGREFLRAVRPEARLWVDGRELRVGGLVGQPNHAYLTEEWTAALQPDPEAMVLLRWTTGTTRAPFPWQRGRRQPEELPWPAPGVGLTFTFGLPAQDPLHGLEVDVCYELLDGLPVLSKWLIVRNKTARLFTLDRFESEILAAVEVENMVEAGEQGWALPPIAAFSAYAFGGMSVRDSNRVVHWEQDPLYATQVNYRRLMPCLLVARPPIGPDARIPAGGVFESFRIFEILHDGTDRERQGLAVRRAFRALAPWCTENPLMMHVRQSDPATVRSAIDQCADVGFEMVILSFGSGFNMEREDEEYLAQMRELADHAHSKGIEIGGYSLFSSRKIGPQHDVIDPETGQPGGARFGNAPCACSEWGRAYFAKIRHFFEATGFDLLEHDGPYPGDVCGSTSHPGHRGLADSQWAQWQVSRDLYRWLRGRGVYINAPDYYFLAGTNKVGMGYRETNWSLPRAQQIIHGRQNVFDGTWTKTPSMGWMFVPLTQYHGGGAAATIEPLDEHRDHYEACLANYLGLGVQACWRGPRLYDTERTRDLLARWVAFFKEYRAILEADLIHLRRADGRDIDAMLHVHPGLEHKGLLMVYNPLSKAVERELRVPLYYTGLTGSARVAEQDGEAVEHELARDYSIRLRVAVPARSHTWFVIR